MISLNHTGSPHPCGVRDDEAENVVSDNDNQKNQRHCEEAVGRRDNPEKYKQFREKSMINNTNPFEFFNLKVTVFINEAELNDRYQAILTSLHPDNFVNDENFMQDSAEKLSAFANDAYQILKNPLTRCKATLDAKDWQIDETITDNEFLMEMMELQEMAANGDTLQPFYDDALYKLESALQNNDKQTSLEAYNRLSFLNRCIVKQ